MTWLGFSRDEKEQIVRDYFGPAGSEETPRCPHCGEELDFRQEPGSGAIRLVVNCRECANGFSWEPQAEVRPWEDLHLRYFVERYRSGQRPRCPVDDCFIQWAEFPEGVLEFRCPYCNRRGRVALSSCGR